VLWQIKALLADQAHAVRDVAELEARRFELHEAWEKS
jgi:hypothetical protein